MWEDLRVGCGAKGEGERGNLREGSGAKGRGKKVV